MTNVGQQGAMEAATAMEGADETMEYLLHVVSQFQGAAVSALVYLGDQLGLYKSMHGAGPVTADALAQRTGLHPRWVLEWLRGQGAAKIIEYRGDGRFELTDVQASVLADEQGSVLFMGGMFASLPGFLRVLEPLQESFRTGIGLPFDAQGEEGAHGTERAFAPWYRHMLVPVVLPSLDGVTTKLAAGAKVADVGCGAGVALIEMAKAFPNSDFHGYELSQHALARAEQNKAEAALDNVTFHAVRGEDVPADGSFDVITSFDCLHDMTRPRDVMAAVRKAIKDDGTYLIADVRAFPTYEENLENNPMTAMMYGFSVLGCMSSALSEPGGEGLGTLGFHTELAADMAKEAGFSRFEVKDLGNPMNLYYELRP